MTFTVVVCGLLFGIGALFAAVRLVRGPTQIDRAVALDVMLAILVGVIVLLAAVNQQRHHPGDRGGGVVAGVPRVGGPGQAAAQGPPMNATPGQRPSAWEPMTHRHRRLRRADHRRADVAAGRHRRAAFPGHHEPDPRGDQAAGSRHHAADAGVGLRLGSPAVIGMLRADRGAAVRHGAGVRAPDRPGGVSATPRTTTERATEEPDGQSAADEGRCRWRRPWRARMPR